MTVLRDLARMTTATTGTGTVTLGSAVSGYLSFAGAGVNDADVVLYGIKDGANSEVGTGTYTSAGTSLTRSVYKSTNSNALLNLSGSAEVFICALAGDGGDLLPATTNPMRGFDMPINCQINASVGSNILTVAIKGNNGSDPSPTNPLLVAFRDPTAANGGPVWAAATAALSIDTNAVGATLGTSSNQAFRLWVVLFNNGGTLVPALINCSTCAGTGAGGQIYPLYEGLVASTTPFSGTATAAGTFYTPNGTTLTSKSFRIIGYVEYNSTGLVTAGTYASAPNFIQLYGPGVPLPGQVIQRIHATGGVAVTGTAAFAATNCAVSVTPKSAANLIVASASLFSFTQSGGVTVAVIRRGTTQNICGPQQVYSSAGQAQGLFSWADIIDKPNATASTTYTVYAEDTIAIGSSINAGDRAVAEIMG